MNFETFEDAIHWRKVHRTKLKTATRRQRRAARPLMKCHRGHRCDTEACRVCLREFRLWWLGEAVRIVVQRPHWTRCSVIPEGWLVPYKQLSGFDLDAEIKRIRKRLERSALHGRVVLGGVDVSLNALNNQIVGWQFHLYLIVEGANDKVLRNAIKAVFAPEPTAQEPYHFEQIDKTGFFDVSTYAYKAFFERRSEFTKSNGKQGVKHQRLKGPDLRRLLPFLARYEVGSRLILSGVRRNGRYLAFTRKAKP